MKTACFVVMTAIIAGSALGLMLLFDGSLNSLHGETPCTHTWVPIGTHGCWGMPDVFQDPRNPSSYIVTWQRYRPGANEHVMDVKYSVYDSKTKAFSPEAYVFDPRHLTILQAHPCWCYWGGRYRICYCECTHAPNGHAVEVTADHWQDFQKYSVSDHEKAATSELNFHAHVQFVPISESKAWLLYTIRNRKDKLYYSGCDRHDGWDMIAHPIPTSTLVGDEALEMGSAFQDGEDVVLYASTYELRPKNRTEKHGVAYRFKLHGQGDAWAAEKVVVAGLPEPFKKSGELFVRVIKTDGKYFLSSQSNDSHRYLAEGTDGIHFRVVQDLGEKPSLGNAMVRIEGTNQILLVYAGKREGADLGGEIECMLVPIESAAH